jgi:cell division protein FtsQ
LKIELKNKIILGLWLLVALSVLVLFVVARQSKKHSLCAGSKVEISGNNQNYFVTEKEVNEIVNASGDIKEKIIESIHIAALENALQQNSWIKNAELYFENNGVLHIDIAQRQPIARLFCVDGSSNYIDKNGLRLPIKNTATSRVLTITNFTSSNNVLANTDSLLLNDVNQLSNFIYADSFWNAQIAAINITSTGKFELVPTIGNHIVQIGNANNLKEKFDRLYTFYTKAWLQNGIETYEMVDVRFNNQVVATRKGSLKNVIDSVANPLLAMDSTILSDSLNLP